ncbi:NADH:ubiquinone reductase (Na(+)-transporting) subunit C [Prevotella veroralis]|uniref:Na(+)-translocating NADH-quinone reductase subunit C n=1 Tax=Prevotella veroralis F0319 TaxID=649761 RepID=C9ML93_9BACT|nr:NADH:ubiquinone reductase (Na(+)-transporting) subunit C [Prevotella veroralis]EEX19427.1 NADH:ubiquinone oxidoreductase, Na(+)-translocating, C subunit [Prevotella veroralis F0319]QUB41889.1 NADH:ubiquinone reductase (Na(+)-transporting) subunit C [Prevotella veroralis]
MKTNSNSYTITYSIILVLIVAFLLAFVFQALKPMQDANVQLDQQKQILFALNQDRNMTNEQAVELWKKIIIADDIINSDGKVVEAGKQGGVDAGFKLNSKDAKEGKLALFRCKVNGEVKYVIPVYGNGLWGPINGFIAINGDKKTIFGAYFNHESETAGLGAEIKDNADWQAKFKGKKLFTDDNNQKIALSVEKKIEDPKTQVDAVTGATLTSNGVTEMFHSDKGGLQPYVKFLTSK